MKIDLAELTTSAQSRVLDAVETVQGGVLGGVQAWSSSARRFLPVDLTILDRLPGAGSLPTPDAVVELSYGFASKVLASQQAFAEQLVAATRPTRKPAAKTAAAKVGSAKS